MLGTGRRARLTDEQLRDGLVECEQAIAMLQATQADAMVQMGARARAADRARWPRRVSRCGRGSAGEQFVPDEIGVLLGWTKMAATVRYGTACRAADLPVVARAWRAGLIDARKVATIGEQVGYLPRHRHRRRSTEPVAAGAGVELGGHASRDAAGPAPQLREWLRRKVIAVEPRRC